MYIENYLAHLQEMILETTFQGKFKKKQIPSAVYLNWCLEKFYQKMPDSYIRVDFKCDKKSLESNVLVLDEDGLSFSMEGNSFSENGHDSYSYDYGQIRRESGENFTNEFLQKFENWFSEVTGILEQKKIHLNIEYYGEFRRNLDYNPPISEDESRSG